MKTILVIDMPEDCYECPCYQSMSGDSFCGVTNEDTMINTDTKPNWCPLKPMPQKMADEDGIISEQKEPTECEWDFISGWNACVDEILREKDD